MEFIPSIPVLTAFTIASLILTLTPGPDMTLFVGRALSQGRAAGLASLFGASTGVVIHTLLAAFGISALIQASPNGFLILKIVGALYLLWLAIQAIREGSSFSLESTKSRPKSLLSNWLTGIGINMLNPKIILFFITFLPQFISSQDTNATGKIIFLGFYFVLFATACCVVIVYAVDKFAHMLKKNPKVTRAIDYLFASVFSAFAIRILFTERG
jgi:threonine/homoserine/homoserine lactone efflux protein